MPDDEDDALARDAELGHELLDRGEDRVVAAARAPADLLVGLQVLRRQRQLAVAVALCHSMRSDRFSQLARAEGHAAHAVVADGVDEELGANELQQLPEVHLGNEHAVVAPEHLARVARQRVEVANVSVGDVATVRAHTAHAGRDRAVRATPAEHEQRGAVRVVHLELGDAGGDARHLLRA